jgi:asparagine synthase (glutamine-hydrolysing)
MCGFLCLIKNQETHLEKYVIQGLKNMFHRGPDFESITTFDNVCMGHLRLTIIDKLGGNQPMQLDKRFTLLFNGEIYNAQELRKELESKNIIFTSSHSDTEVIYRGFQSEGINFFRKLSGMFSIVINDRFEKKVYAIRDLVGIKPLYFLNHLNTYGFSSEIKGFKILNISKSLKNLDQIFLNRSTIGSDTLFNGISRVNPGELIKIDLKTMNFSRSKNFLEYSKIKKNDFKNLKLSSVIEKAVKRQIIADVKVGVFLSGGVDSSIIAAFASRYGIKDVFTISTDSVFDEAKYAKLVAKKFNLNLHILKLTGKDFLKQISRWSILNDDLTTDPSAYALLLLSDFARSKGFKVLLSGDGADELFGGYNAHTRFIWAKRLKKFFNKLFDISLISSIDPRLFDYMTLKNFFYLGAAHASDAKLINIILGNKNDKSHFFDYTENKAGLYVSNKWLQRDLDIRLSCDILNRTDRATMGASIEARVPYLDDEVLKYVSQLKSSQRFGFFGFDRKKILKDIAVMIGIPKECIYRRKIGFELPIKKWLMNDLSTLIRSFLNDKAIKEIDYSGVELILDNLNNKKSHKLSVSTLWAWLSLEMWNKNWKNF